MAFGETKVYFDGSHYIAIPHTTRPKRWRPKAKEEEITVIEKTEVGTLDNSSVPSVFVSVNSESDCNEKEVKNAPDFDTNDKFEEDTEEVKVVQPAPQKQRKMTRKDLFNELYDKYIDLNKKKRKDKIIEEMLSYFKTIDVCKEFVEKQFERKQRNLIARRVRMTRKANLANFNYFCTFTYDSKLHTEKSFKKGLQTCFRNLCYRKNWKYMGVWERAPETNRLHFHGLFSIPENAMVGNLKEVKDYDKKEQKNSSSKDNKALNFLKKFLGFEDDEEEIENEFAYENEFSNQVRKVKSPTNYKEKEIENNNENIKPVEDNNKNDIKEEYKEYGEIFNKNDDFTKDDLDIFEKFKKLKAEEEEKAKKIRAREKARQLEELKRQEEEAKNARYAQNYEETFGEPPTSKVRVVGKVETEEAKEELKKVKELSKKRNFELEYNDDNKSKKKKSDNDKYIKKTSKPNCAKNVDKVTEDDYNFESHSPVEEDDQDTGFDFLDKYKD